jgi:hypothetical protein
MKRKLAWVCLLVLPLVLGSAALCFSDRDPITKANCDRIKNGMALSEVEALLGRGMDSKLASQLGPALCCWQGSRGTIMVVMDFADPSLVETARFSASEPRTIFDKIRNWLGL